MSKCYVHQNLIRPVSESSSESWGFSTLLLSSPAPVDISGLESVPRSGDTQQSPSSDEQIWV